MNSELIRLIQSEWDFGNAQDFARQFAARHNVSSSLVESYLRRSYPYASISEPAKRGIVKRWVPKRWVNAQLKRGAFMMSDTMRLPKGFHPPVYGFVVGLTDYYSKQVYLEVVTRITSAKVTEAFIRITKRINYPIEMLLTDQGTVSVKTELKFSSINYAIIFRSL